MVWTKPYTPSRNQRLHPSVYSEVGQFVFVTIRAFQHQSPFVRTSLNQMIIDTLRDDSQERRCMVYAYCLMPDHLHYLITPQVNGTSILEVIHRYKGKTTNNSWELGWQGKLWQPRYYDHVVRNEENLISIAEYILNNPVRKGMVQNAQDFKWCGFMNNLPL